MVGIGETDDEVLETMGDLRAAGVDVVTIGQYLRPTPKHAAVDRYVDPGARSTRFAREGRAMGFAFVASGPLVRSSYRAAEVFLQSKLRRPEGNGVAGEAAPEADETREAGTAFAQAEPLLPAAALVRR